MDIPEDKLEDVWREYEKQLKAHREHEKNSLEIFPVGEFVVKSKLLKPILNEDNTVAVPAGTKVFVNFCSNEHIPLPRIEKDPSTNEDRLRVPISCDHFGATTDNKGEHALVVDVVFNSTTIKLCKGNIDLSHLSDAEMNLISALDIASLPQFRMYCVEFALQNIVVKYKVDVDNNNATFLKNLKYKGEGAPKPQRIRRQPSAAPRPSALDSLRNVAEEDDDDAFVRPAAARPRAAPEAPSASSAKVELLEEPRARRLGYRLLCVPPRAEGAAADADAEPVPLLQYFSDAIARDADRGAAPGLPAPPSHVLVRVVGAEGVRAAGVSVRCSAEAIHVDFARHNADAAGAPRGCAYEGLLLRLPLALAPGDTHCRVDREAAAVTVTTSVTGYSRFWTRVAALLARDPAEGPPAGDAEAAAACERVLALRREAGRLGELRGAWRAAEREGRRLYLGEEEEAEEEGGAADACELLGLQSEFLNMLFLRAPNKLELK